MANKEKQFCVIGLGEYGFSLARSLAEKGAYVMAIDSDNNKVEEIKKYVSQAIQFDATDPVLLKEQGVANADCVIIAIGETFEPVVLICMELLNENVKRIIARASSTTQEMVLRRIGIEEVIHPEKDEGIRMATALLNTSIDDYFKLSDTVGIYEMQAPSGLVGYSLKELKLRQRYDISLITIKRAKNKKQSQSDPAENYDVLGVLDPLTMIRKTDLLVIMGSEASIEKLILTN